MKPKLYYTSTMQQMNVVDGVLNPAGLNIQVRLELCVGVCCLQRCLWPLIAKHHWPLLTPIGMLRLCRPLRVRPWAACCTRP